MKSKKLLLGSLSAMALVATPIATVVSCGKKADTNTYTKLEKSDLDDFVRTLGRVTKKETNAEYIDYIKHVFERYLTQDGKSLDLKSLDKIKGTTDADVTKVLEAAKKIDAYTHERKASNAEVYVFSENIKLDKVLSKAELKTLQGKDVIVKTPGNAEVTAVIASPLDATQAGHIHSMIDRAKTEKAILDLLAKYETVAGHAPLITTSVTGVTNSDAAAKLTAQKTKAKALIVSRTVGTKAVSAVKEVKTVVTILGKDYTLKSFANDQTDKKMSVNPGLAKDVPAKLQVLKFRVQVKDVATYKQAIKYLMVEEWKIFADDKGKKLNFTKLDAATTKEAVLKEAKALIVEGVSTTLDLSQR